VTAIAIFCFLFGISFEIIFDMILDEKFTSLQKSFFVFGGSCIFIYKIGDYFYVELVKFIRTKYKPVHIPKYKNVKHESIPSNTPVIAGLFVHENKKFGYEFQTFQILYDIENEIIWDISRNRITKFNEFTINDFEFWYEIPKQLHAGGNFKAKFLDGEDNNADE